MGIGDETLPVQILSVNQELPFGRRGLYLLDQVYELMFQVANK